MLPPDLAGGDQFLQLFFHKSSKNSLAMLEVTLLGRAFSKTKRNCRSRPAATRKGRGLRGKRARPRAAVACARGPRPMPGNSVWRGSLAGHTGLAHRPKD